MLDKLMTLLFKTLKQVLVGESKLNSMLWIVPNYSHKAQKKFF